MRVSHLTFAFWVACLSLALALNSSQEAEAAQSLEPKSLEAKVDVSLKYLLALPTGYEEKEKWPVMLFLHGAGERGDDLNRVLVHGPPKLITKGQEFPMIVVAPQCPKGRWWKTTELEALLDEIEENYKVDADRIYVTGLSMGGFGTWALAHAIPDRIAAIAPICGGGLPNWTKNFVHVPAWVFHGAKDTVVTVDNSKVMVEALEKAGGDVRLTIYPEAGHDSWTETYDNPKLYEWLLSHRRKAMEPVPPVEDK